MMHSTTSEQTNQAPASLRLTVARPQAIIDETLDQLARANSAEVALPGAYPELQSSIQLFIRNLNQGVPVGPAR